MKETLENREERQILAEKKAYYCKDENLSYAGKHLLVEMWQVHNIANAERVSEILKQAVEACGATLLNTYTHVFTPYNGVSGVAVLQESHIAIHTWPELGYAAVDIFVCGNVDPYKAIPVFQEAFQPHNIQVMEFKRGIFNEEQLVL